MKLQVKVDFKTTFRDLIEGFLFCTDNMEKVDEYIIGDNELTEKGKKLIDNNLVNTENPHMQLLNQVQIRIQIENTTRAVLQEFARHRLGNEMTVKSTRYALHKIARDKRIGADFGSYDNEEIVKDYYYIPHEDFTEPDEKENWLSNRMNELVQIQFYKNIHNIKNDQLKKYVNDYMYTNINTMMSGTALKNFLRKRLDPVSFYQIKDLAGDIFKNIPEDWQPIFRVYKDILEKSEIVVTHENSSKRHNVFIRRVDLTEGL